MPLWHYAVGWRMLRDGFLRSPWPVTDTERVVDRLLAGLGAGGLANMDGLAVGPFERDGDAILPGKRTTYPFPAQMYPSRLELEADRMASGAWASAVSSAAIAANSLRATRAARATSKGFDVPAVGPSWRRMQRG